MQSSNSSPKVKKEAHHLLHQIYASGLFTSKQLIRAGLEVDRSPEETSERGKHKTKQKNFKACLSYHLVRKHIFSSDFPLSSFQIAFFLAFSFTQTHTYCHSVMPTTIPHVAHCTNQHYLIF